ncbi:MAG: hypothetical protein B7Z12_09615, partial [Caulobacter vibrioides]
MKPSESRPSRPGERRLSWLWLAVVASLMFALLAARPASRVDNLLYDVLARANTRPADDSILIIDFGSQV